MIARLIPGLHALNGACADLTVGNREIDAALWWLYADHAETDAGDLRKAESDGAAAFLDAFIGARAWRDQTTMPMVPRLSTSLDDLRRWTHTHLPGWSRVMAEPSGVYDEAARPSVAMRIGTYATGPITAPLLELAAFKAAITACLAQETGEAQVHVG